MFRPLVGSVDPYAPNTKNIPEHGNVCVLQCNSFWLLCLIRPLANTKSLLFTYKKKLGLRDHVRLSVI